jgi:hypothetical protein
MAISFVEILDCVFLVRGSGRIPRTTCIVRSPTGFELRPTPGGNFLDVRENCTVTGDINGCELDGTMTRSKDAIHGVGHCVPPPDSSIRWDFLTTFTMVRR